MRINQIGCLFAAKVDKLVKGAAGNKSRKTQRSTIGFFPLWVKSILPLATTIELYVLLTQMIQPGVSETRIKKSAAIHFIGQK